MKLKILFILVFLLSFITYAQTADSKADAKSIVKQMTLEEKARFVVGMGRRGPSEKQPNAVSQIEEKVKGAAGETFSIPRLGIPSLVLADGPAGVRIDPIRKNDSSKTYYATGFPVATLLASTWDTALVEKVGKAFGNEVLEYGVDILLAPGMNIHRNPLGGRNFEYYSEDPVIAGNMAASMVKGVQSMGVGTSIKHFAGNNQESNRRNVNTIVSPRALREIYLKGFEIAVKKADPWTVMSSYNKINGTYTSESSDLLTKILRDDWKYKGFVMTDWSGGKDAIAQMQAGNDLLMPGTAQQTQDIIDAVNKGTLDVKILDQNVERILNIIFMTPAYRNYKYSNKPDLKGNAQISRSAASEGMVLLKNQDNLLPLKNGMKIALFGNNSYDLIAGGTGSGDVHKAYIVSLNEGLKNAGFKTDVPLETQYRQYIAKAKAEQPKASKLFLPPPIAQMTVSDEIISQQADQADVAVITIGRNSGEFNDRKLENDYYINEQEQKLIKNISDAFHAKGKKTAVVLNIGGVIEVSSWKDKADAILLAWQPGQEGGNAIADILSGKVNPSGKLATTFPVDYKDVPSSNNFPGLPKENPEKVVYEEGIFTGYRYYNTFNVKPAYEFGYGLSYTSFDYKDLKLSASEFKDKLTAAVTIENTGSAPGKEAVELYISAPSKKLQKPSEELKAFAKTKLLKPGESEVITFVINPTDLSSFDTETSSWTAEGGKYTVKIGASSSNIKQTASFELPSDLVVEKLSTSLPLQEPINEVKK